MGSVDKNPVPYCIVALMVVMMALSYGIQSADAQVITYRIHSDIFTELQDRYPEHAEDYWSSVKKAIRDGINAWIEVNPDLVVTPSHDERHNLLIEWIDSERVWGVEYHDRSLGYRIGIDFDSPEPDEYGASLLNPDIIKYVVAHEMGHVLGMGHSSDENHLMHGVENPKPKNIFDSKGYVVPHLSITDYRNIGGTQLDVSFHLQGYNVHDVAVVDINGTQYLVASTGNEGLHVLDMSNPDQPGLMDMDDSPSTDVWPLEGQPHIVQMYSDGFRVWSLSDPANIILLETVSHNSILDATLIYVDDTPLLVMVSKGLIQQYDLSDPHDARKSGAHHDNFNLLGVEDIHGVVRDSGSTYVLVDATFDGILPYLIQPDKNPARVWHSFDQVEYYDHIQRIIEIDGSTYRITSTHDQIELYSVKPKIEPSDEDPETELIGHLLGYTVLGVDILEVGDSVYAVVATGPDGILGIHVGDKGAGKWTVG
ncbi:MAG: matrixin family metalloprotease [Cenarchaeum sp. SB0664_bin_35]|nr:matrixin family metalloprotease [Cenarchaeum sp. SB0664_bin_35]